MRILLRRLFAFSACLMLVAGLTLAGDAHAQSEGSKKGELVIGITQFPSKLHPSIESLLARTYVLGLARRPITVHDHEFELVCMLCEKLPTISNGLAEITETDGKPSGVKLKLLLPEEAKWGDGTPISTKDILFSWEVGRHPQSGVALAEIYNRISDIEAINQREFIITMDQLKYDYNNLSDFAVLPAHLERQPFSDPREYKSRTLYETDPTNKGLYYGPYLITEIVPGSHIVYEKNPLWWGKEPAFNRVIVKAVENTAALEANLLAGEVDMVAGELGFNLDQAASFEQRYAEKYNIVFESSLVFANIALNLDNPILKDVRVRRALLMALDRQTLTQELFLGYQPVATSFVHPFEWFYDDSQEPHPFDPEEAARLLDEAGWTEVKDDVRHNTAGNALRLELMTTAGNRTRERVQQILQDQWRKVGIDVRIRNQPARVLFGQTVRQREFTGMAMFDWILAPEAVPRSMFHSDSIPAPGNNFGGENFMGYRNPEVDALIEELEQEIDVSRRLPMWQALQRIYASDLPTLPLYSGANMHVQPKWLGNARPSGHQAPSTYWIEEWEDNRS